MAFQARFRGREEVTGFVADLVERLQELGFSAYEAKAYLALLRRNPSTGYELSRISGIPSAKIYETLDRLQSRGALAVVLGNPVRYVPITPGELISRVRCRFESSLAGLEDSLDREATESNPEFVWNIRQYDLILGRAAELVRAATREVAVFAWAEECLRLAEEFDLAVNRGVDLLGVVCGDIQGLPQLVRHGFEEVVLEEQGKLFVMVRDAEEALIGGIGAEANAALTRNTGLVRVAGEYIKHEIYQAKIMRHYGRRFIEDFGPRGERLRPKGGNED